MPEILFLSPLAVALLAVLAGMALLIRGGDAVVDSAAFLAAEMKIQPMIIGFTVIAFGTSLPELFVTVDANFSGAPGLAIGNVLGSNIANILLILGIAALMGPIAAPFARLRADLAWMTGSALLLVPLFLDGRLTRAEGGLLALGIAVYLALAFRRRDIAETGQDEAVAPMLPAVLRTLAGLVLLILGARLMVDASVGIARAFGVSEAVIGLTIVAVGTSLPELAASVAAALKGARDIAIGNVIGSNIFNILAILGVSALVAPLAVAPGFLMRDLPVMLGVSVLLCLALALRGRLGRGGGAALLGDTGSIWERWRQSEGVLRPQ